MSIDLPKIKDVIDTSKGHVVIYRLNRLEEMGFENISRLPYSIKVLLESLLRQLDGKLITEDDIRLCAQCSRKRETDTRSLSYRPGFSFRTSQAFLWLWILPP